MAVDVEPCVFWRGDLDTSCLDAPDGVEARVSQWMADVDFQQGDAQDLHGYVSESPLNGPSGQELDGYFDGLDVKQDESVIADVYPVFMVHRKARPGQRAPTKGRAQGDAIDAAYNPIATRLLRRDGSSFQESTLPTRPIGRWEVPQLAVDRFGSWITELILEINPELIVTLGQEPWDTLTRLRVRPRHSAGRVAELRLHGYGDTGSIRLEGRTFNWLPLPHPGLLMKAKPSSSGPSWSDVHNAWASH